MIVDRLRRRRRPELPDVMRSFARGREREVRVEWRPRPDGNGKVPVRGPVGTVLGHLAQFGLGVAIGVPLLLIALLLPRTGDAETPAHLTWWLGLGGVWAAFVAYRLFRLVRAVPDLWRRRELEGAVLRYAVDAREGRTGNLAGHSYYLGVDDGRRGLVTMYGTGFEPWGPGLPLGDNPYHSLRRGDVVRLTVAPGSGHVLRVRPLADAEGGPPPSIDVAPFLPHGAPLTTRQVSAGTSTAVRRVAHHHAGAANCVDVYVYHLIEDVPAKLEVFVCRSRTALADVRAATRAGDSLGAPAGRADYPSERYPGGLLIGGTDSVAVGVRPPVAGGRAGPSWPADVHLLNEALRTLTKK